MIAHPQSPFQGQHYKDPVELIDIFPTLIDLTRAPFNRNQRCKNSQDCLPLSGKSLAPIILGDEIYSKTFQIKKKNYEILNHNITNIHDMKRLRHIKTQSVNSALTMPSMNHKFALSQTVRCCPKSKTIEVAEYKAKLGKPGHKPERFPYWGDCDKHQTKVEEVQLMGYAMRTPEYRYIVYFHYNKIPKHFKIDFDSPPYAQELYDHKNETLSDYTHRETFNLATRPAYTSIMNNLRLKLISYIKENVIFHTHID